MHDTWKQKKKSTRSIMKIDGHYTKSHLISSEETVLQWQLSYGSTDKKVLKCT